MIPAQGEAQGHISGSQNDQGADVWGLADHGIIFIRSDDFGERL